GPVSARRRRPPIPPRFASAGSFAEPVPTGIPRSGGFPRIRPDRMPSAGHGALADNVWRPAADGSTLGPFGRPDGPGLKVCGRAGGTWDRHGGAPRGTVAGRGT